MIQKGLDLRWDIVFAGDSAGLEQSSVFQTLPLQMATNFLQKDLKNKLALVT